MADLIIKIGAESKQFQEELDKISEKTADLSDQMATVAKIATVAFGALVAEATLAVRAYAAQEKATNNLTQALQNQGLYSKQLADNYRNQASQLQKLTGVDDDAIVSGQALLQTMIGQREITQEMSTAAVDLAARLGGDVSQGFEALGQAINGRTRALKQMGIEIDENLTKEERTAQILEKVKQAIGGTAEANNKGLGSIEGLKSSFGDFQEALGERFAPLVVKVTKHLTEFFDRLATDDALINLIASLGGAAIAVTGLIATVASIGVAFLAITPVVAAFGLTLSTALGPIFLVAAAVAGIGAAVGAMAVSNKKAEESVTSLDDKISAMQEKIKNLTETKGYNLFGGDPNQDKDIQKLNNQLEILKARRDELARGPKVQPVEQDPVKAAEADANAAIERRREKDELAARFAHNELLKAQQRNASKDLLDIYEQEANLKKQLTTTTNAQERDAINDQLDEVLLMKRNAEIEEISQREIFRNEVLAQNEEFQALDAEQQQQFLDQYQSQLLASIETERQTRAGAMNERAQQQAAANNLFLKEQKKYGTEYAIINKKIRDIEENEQFKTFTSMAKMQTSQNSTLKAIGKAAAIAQITIDTAKSAMSIYAGFSTIPIVGPALGIAGAAAAVAFGAEQIGKVTAAADGGIMTGGIAGRDSIPTLTMPGEIVVPTKNFDEVVNAVADQRIRQDDSGRGGLASVEGTVGVSIEFMGDDAEKVITARQTQARALGTFRG